eukprot:149934-Amphidinium_carterae.1
MVLAWIHLRQFLELALSLSPAVGGLWGGLLKPEGRPANACPCSVHGALRQPRPGRPLKIENSNQQQTSGTGVGELGLRSRGVFSERLRSVPPRCTGRIFFYSHYLRDVADALHRTSCPPGLNICP